MSSLGELAEQLGAFLRFGTERRRALPGRLPSEGALRRQLLSLGTKLLQSRQMAPVASLAAVAGPLANDPVLLLLQVACLIVFARPLRLVWSVVVLSLRLFCGAMSSNDTTN